VRAIVTEIQVGGYHNCKSLEEACEAYLSLKGDLEIIPRTKIHFDIKLPSGIMKTITIRDEDNQTVAYGDFEGLPSFLDYAEEVIGVEPK